MRFLVDHNVGRGVAIAQRLAGYDAAFVGEVDPGMEDHRILAWAVSEGRIVITQDPDFGALVYQSGKSHSGVMLLRMPGSTRGEKVRVVLSIVEQQGGDLVDRFAVYENGRLRVR
jgi:predicted nuclease of predicted toxin-antitoxin system